MVLPGVSPCLSAPAPSPASSGRYCCLLSPGASCQQGRTPGFPLGFPAGWDRACVCVCVCVPAHPLPKCSGFSWHSHLTRRFQNSTRVASTRLKPRTALSSEVLKTWTEFGRKRFSCEPSPFPKTALLNDVPKYPHGSRKSSRNPN